MSQTQIVTHGDFDGIVSAALVGIWSRLRFVFFTGPENVRRTQIGPKAIVCALPHPAREVRAWFDHHAGNIEEAKAMGWSAGEGAAFEAPSAARVIYEHLKATAAFPDFIEQTVRATDRVDSMDYPNIEAWLAEDPENVINATIFLPGEDITKARRYLQRLVHMIQNRPLSDVAEHGEVRDRYKLQQEHGQRALETIERVGRLVAQDEICVIDFSEMKVTPRFSKNLAYQVFPGVYAVIMITPVVQGGRRTNDLRLSFSLNPFIDQTLADHSCAAIFDALELGGGHAAAAGGKIHAESKDDRQRLRDRMIDDVARLWLLQVETHRQPASVTG